MDVLRPVAGVLSISPTTVVPRRPAGKLAAEILERTGAKGLPVDLNKVVAGLGNVRVEGLDLDGAGFLVDDPGRTAHILFDSKTVGTRRARFTIAHEIGHVVTNRLSREPDNHRRVRPASPDQAESWCDEFAVELLMPPAMVRGFLDGKTSTPSREVIEAGATTFDVSFESFAVRLAEVLSLTICFTSKRFPGDPITVKKVIPKAIDEVGVREVIRRRLEMEAAHGGTIPQRLRVPLLGQIRTVWTISDVG